MIDKNDFAKKQIIYIFVNRGDRLSFKNDNIVVKDQEDVFKFQVTCYRVFMLIIIGDTTLTSGLIRRSKKFGFTINMMTLSMKLYSTIGNRMEGNTLLHRIQYEYNKNDLAKYLVKNKIINQRDALKQIRNRTPGCKDAIKRLDEHIDSIDNVLTIESLLGIEGSAARTYFPQIFSNVIWNGRKPRVKNDYINTTLDIGYNILFNFIDALLSTYGFDVYQGVLHRTFYMRKSLVCDLMEPCRPIIDLEIRKAINLEQCKREDFTEINHQWVLEYQNSKKYVSFIANAILKHKDDIFLYIQQYYRCFMKRKDAIEFPEFKL